METTIKPRCSRCGEKREDHELNGVDLFPDQPEDKYKHAYCRKLAQCQSQEASHQLQDLLSHL